MKQSAITAVTLLVATVLAWTWWGTGFLWLIAATILLPLSAIAVYFGVLRGIALLARRGRR